MTVIFNGATYYLSDYLNCMKFIVSVVMLVWILQLFDILTDEYEKIESAWIVKYKKTAITLSAIGSALWFLWFQ